MEHGRGSGQWVYRSLRSAGERRRELKRRQRERQLRRIAGLERLPGHRPVHMHRGHERQREARIRNGGGGRDPLQEPLQLAQMHDPRDDCAAARKGRRRLERERARPAARRCDDGAERRRPRDGLGAGGVERVGEPHLHRAGEPREDRLPGRGLAGVVDRAGDRARGIGERPRLAVAHLGGHRAPGGRAPRDDRQARAGGDGEQGQGQPTVGDADAGRPGRRRLGGQPLRLRAAAAPAPPMRPCPRSAQKKQGGEAGQDGHRGRGVQLLQPPADPRHGEPERADELCAGDTLGVAPRVVVAAEDVAAVGGDRDDPVQDGDVQLAAAVGDDVAHPVVAHRPHQGQVAGVEPRLHADPVGDDIGGAAAERRRGEEEPARTQPDQPDEQRRDSAPGAVAGCAGEVVRHEMSFTERREGGSRRSA